MKFVCYVVWKYTEFTNRKEKQTHDTQCGSVDRYRRNRFADTEYLLEQFEYSSSQKTSLIYPSNRNKILKTNGYLVTTYVDKLYM